MFADNAISIHALNKIAEATGTSASLRAIALYTGWESSDLTIGGARAKPATSQDELSGA